MNEEDLANLKWQPAGRPDEEAAPRPTPEPAFNFEPLTQAPGAQPPKAAESAPDPARIAKERVFELETQLSDRERQVQRLAADFENFRRRAASEKEELIGFAASRVLENFLPILDNFERALSHAQSGDPAGILQGVELIYKQVQDFLTRHGVAAMEPMGQSFDPNLHEAIASLSTTEHPDHTVLAIAQKGYFLNGRVLRHAMVQVADNPASPPQDSAQDSPPQGSANDQENPPTTKEESHG